MVHLHVELVNSRAGIIIVYDWIGIVMVSMIAVICQMNLDIALVSKQLYQMLILLIVITM